MKKTLRRLLHNPEGQSAIEYGLLLSLIVLVMMTMVGAIHDRRGGLIAAAAIAAPR